MNPIENPVVRRFLAMIVGATAIALNKKLGLEMDAESQKLLVEFLGVVILASNTKEAYIKKAEMAGKAAETVTTAEAADKVVVR